MLALGIAQIKKKHTNWLLFHPAVDLSEKPLDNERGFFRTPAPSVAEPELVEP
jgi:hypothetical protein